MCPRKEAKSVALHVKIRTPIHWDAAKMNAPRETEAKCRPESVWTRIANWLTPFLIAFGCIAYVYRFPVMIGNASLFRVDGIVIGLVILIRLINGSALSNTKLLSRSTVPFCVSGILTLVAVGETAVRVMPPVYAAGSLVQTLNVIIFLLVFAFIDSRATLLRLIRAYIVVSVLETVIAIDALITGKLLFSSLIEKNGAAYLSGLSFVNDSDGLRRLTGTFYDPNFYGIYLCTVVALASWLLIQNEGSRLDKIAIALSITQIFLTASRTAMVGLCIIGAVLLFMEKRARPYVIRVGLLVTPIVVALFALFSTSPLLERILSGQSFQDRFSFFARGLAAFARSPIFGSGTLALIDPDSGIATAHDLYISVLGKFGVLGAGAYAAFIFVPLAFGKIRPNTIGDRTLAALCILPLAGMYLSYDFFEFLEFQYIIFSIAYAAVFVSPDPDV